MKVLITGGSGFIGKSTAEVLQKNGLQVRVYDLLRSTFPV
jgi:nucleoside-diphosphate-sugar epimerase